MNKVIRRLGVPTPVPAPWVPSKRDQAIIDKALEGIKPKTIASELGNITADIAREVVKKARRNGIAIPLFRGEGEPRSAENYARRQRETSKPVAEEKRPVHAFVPPNHFELAALKKMLGADLEAIERRADAAQMSVPQYVCDVMRGHVRGTKP